jgi:mono/diheme cytochrome c family protein
MHRIILFFLVLFITVSTPLAWGWTLVSHPGEKIEDGLEFLPLCPQVRKTQQAPDAFLKLQNPLPATPENVFAGQTLFHFDAKPGPCRVCHGISGNGLGILFRELAPSPRNFTCSQTIDPLPDGQLFWVIKNGSPGTAMPAFKNMDDDQVWQLVHYIRHFSGKGH